MSKTAVTIKVTSDRRIRVELNGKTVLRRPGSSTVELANDKNHAMTWFVEGEKGDSYTIEIVKPDSLKWSYTGTLDEGGHDEGRYVINL